MTAPTTSLAALDAQARAAQARNAAQVSALTLALWMQTIDSEDISTSSTDWLQQVVQFILRGRQESYRIAVAYARAVRKIQAPSAPAFEIPRPPDPPREQLLRSLIHTGPRELAVNLAKTPDVEEPAPGAPPADVERAERARSLKAQTRDQLVRNAGVKAAASAFKYTANGGRDTTDLIVVRDPVALGYVRVTRDKPCAFCLMLASRGPVYSEDSFDESDPRFTGPGNHKVHDSCACTLRPVYRRTKDNWTDTAKVADELWRQMLKDNPGIGGAKARNKFAQLAREAGIADLSRW